MALAETQNRLDLRSVAAQTLTRSYATDGPHAHAAVTLAGRACAHHAERDGYQGHAPAFGLRAGTNGLLNLSQTEEIPMTSSPKNRVRLSIEALEHRDTAAALAIVPTGWTDPDPTLIVKAITASAQPGLATAEAHSRG